jgi:hypothetical protein
MADKKHTTADTLMGKPRTKLNLTEQESRIVQYHDDTMRSGKVGVDKEGRPITVYSIGIKIPAGEPNAGKFVSVPGWNRDENRTMNDREAYDFWQKDIRAGKWPTYNSGAELDKRSQQIHEIMNDDADRPSKKIGS